MKAVRTIFIIFIAAAILAGAGYGAWYYLTDGGMIYAPDFNGKVGEFASGLLSSAYSKQPETENGRALYEIFKARASTESLPGTRTHKSAAAAVNYYNVSESAYTQALADTVRDKITEKAGEKRFLSEIYDAQDNILPELTQESFNEAVAELDPASFMQQGSIYIDLSYDGTAWYLSSEPDTQAVFTADFDAMAENVLSSALEALPKFERSFTVDRASLAPAPAQSAFGSTGDSADITALLQDNRAQRLIGGDKTAWSEDIELLEGSVINYYLDETILMLQWQENTDDCCGTYSEIFIADASQLRRKIAGDSYGSYDFNYATEFAKQNNAVLASGGDFYHHGRQCGIVVIGGEIFRFEPNTCDTLYFDRNGDMLYSRRGEFTEQAQAQALVDENGVDFSLCFGPVLIDEGTDVTPESYAWGEINDTYARSSIGQLGELHYFIGNLNCFYNTPHTLATLKQMTEAMLAHGCYTAYALDGGQTAETVVNGVMINPVQFATEKAVSDIIYFVTAVPEE